MTRIEFTHTYLKNELVALKNASYQFITCEEFVKRKQNSTLDLMTIVLRVDIDLSVKKTERLVDIFNELQIKGSFFLRLHAPEYNPFSFENYRIIKNLIQSGHELGYHSEVIDQAHIWNEDAEQCLLRDINVINRIFGIAIKGVASHGGMTGLNNLDFWIDRKPGQYGLLYEGYDKEPAYNIFQEAFYISDSEWTRWKCYNKGHRIEMDHRSPSQHIADNHPLINLLIHPDSYYNNNFYDNEK